MNGKKTCRAIIENMQIEKVPKLTILTYPQSMPSKLDMGLLISLSPSCIYKENHPEISGFQLDCEKLVVF